MRHTGENDPYDISIATMNIMKTKHYRKVYITIRKVLDQIYGHGSNVIVRLDLNGNSIKEITRLNKLNFIRRMNNKVYITKTKPGVFERNARFKLTSNCVTNVRSDVEFVEKAKK